MNREENMDMTEFSATASGTQLRAQLAERSAHLREVAATLKSELFGIDAVIDQVIESVRAWYVLPQLVSRPVIVCLWGLTGTGKTQLVRRLAQLLGFYDRFVEVQMDGFSNGASRYNASSIAAMLGQSGIAEGAPGILALDEFQRFRTINREGEDVKLERYQDVWALLSDGRLPPTLALLENIEMTLADAAWQDMARGDRGNNKEKKKQRPRKFSLSPWEASDLRATLKLDQPLPEIMAWTPAEVQSRLYAFRESTQSWDTDYSKLLIFVCGNLDEMYADVAASVEDCDTDADVFHALTSKLSVIDVKKALTKRFKPEQIARLGNDHVIYPSLSSAAYRQLIASACARYIEQAESNAGLRFALGDDVLAQIYANGVFPAQGTRPLFSSIHAILSGALVNAALWALQHGAGAQDTVRLSMPAGQPLLMAELGEQRQSFAVPLELDRIKRRASADFRTLVAVHEAGHGLAYALLFGRAPREIKINLASFEGGYNSYVSRKAWSRQNLLDDLCVTLAGRAAEVLVFGPNHATTGAEGDLEKATASAARFVRHQGFAGSLSRVDVATGSDENLNTDVRATNAAIETLLAEAHARAAQLLREHQNALLCIVDALLQHGSIPPATFSALLGRTLPASDDAEPLEPYAQRLADFRARLPRPAAAQESDNRQPVPLRRAALA
jgi:cell division protease FtsH